MLTLWYIILGWKEYNKPFRKPAQPAKPTENQRKDGAAIDNKKPELPKSIPFDPPKAPSIPPRGSDSIFSNNKTPEPPKPVEIPKARIPESPKTPEVPKLPEIPKSLPKTPETPKLPELPKIAPKTPEPKSPETPKIPEKPKTPETPKSPELPKFAPRTPEPPKVPELPKSVPKTPESPKVPELPKVSPLPKSPESPKIPELPKTPRTPDVPGMMPSRRPESNMPDFPPSTRNPAYVPPSNPSEFSLPPFVPGTPGNQKPLSRDDELFGMGNNLRNQDFNPSPNKPFGNLRDLSYGRGELPDDTFENGGAFKERVQDNLSKLPKYMEQSVISNPDSLEDSEEDE